MTIKAKGKKVAPAKKVVDANPKKLKTVELKASKVDLDALRKPLAEAKAAFDVARGEAAEIEKKAQSAIKQAKDAYLKLLVRYRVGCRRAGTKCEFEGARGESVTKQVRFDIERTDRGIKVGIRGVPKSVEVMPFAAFKASSVSKLAYAYTDKHIGPRERVGNKGGGLSNRLRALVSGPKKS